jgi:signal transduction histidine kinase
VTLSFRTRLFVSAALIVAAVLAAVLLLGWSRVFTFEVNRLDERLCREGRRIATQPVLAEQISRLESELVNRLRLVNREQLQFRFESPDGERSFQSVNWTSKLVADNLQWGDLENQVEAAPPPPPPPPPGGRFEPFDRRPPPGACKLASFTSEGRDWRVARFSTPFGRALLAADLAATQAEMLGALQSALGIVIPLALALTAAGAWLLSSLTMRPVNRLREAMQGMTQQALDRRLPSAGEDREFKQLIAVYNRMLARLEASFVQASRFSADAAHELKTPLTILRGRIEQAIQHSPQGSLQAELAGMQDEVDRLTGITRKLLLLSQADAGRLALTASLVDLSQLLDDLIGDVQMLLTNQQCEFKIEPQLRVEGDALLLSQLLNNLVSNALSYCSAGGWIQVAAKAMPAGLEVLVANSSQLIDAESRSRFFDRFYRGDAAHNRAVEGSGLGLSLAREIARAHGGELTLEMTADDQVRMRLWLPFR